MKKRMFAIFLALLMGSQPMIPAFAQSMEEVPEESETARKLTEEERLIVKMYDTDLLATIFIGKSFWYNEEEFEDMRADLPQILLDYYENEGVDTGELDVETLRDLLDTAYESGISANTLEIAALLFEDDYEPYRDAILTVFEEQTLESGDEDMLLLEENEYPEMALMYKDGWYGDRTDDERIALADEILSVLETAGVDTKDYTGNTLAQAINDLYDQDAGDSVLYLAFDILGEGELYISVLESILSGLQQVVYLT